MLRKLFFALLLVVLLAIPAAAAGNENAYISVTDTDDGAITVFIKDIYKVLSDGDLVMQWPFEELDITDDATAVLAKIDAAVAALNIFASAVLTDNGIIVGDGGAYGVQTTPVLVDPTTGDVTGVNDLTVNDDFSVTGDVASVAQAAGTIWTTTKTTEALTIPVDSGADPVVESTYEIPANSVITGFCWKVTTAPGGGATEVDIGTTGGGDLDQLTDGASCDVLNEYGGMWVNGTGLPIPVPAARTLTFTTDSDVTVSAMVITFSIEVRTGTYPADGS